METFPLNVVNQFVLGKHHLTDASQTDDLVQLVTDVGGLHATGPMGPYLALHARTRHFTRKRLEDGLYTKRTLGKLRGMRKTVYVVPKTLIPMVVAATRRMIAPTSEKYAKRIGVTSQDYKDAADKILPLLRGTGLTTRELRQALGTRLPVTAIVNLMCDTGLLIRGRPSGGWKSNLHTYHLFHEYFPDVDLQDMDEDAARARLVEEYLTAFGPATVTDVAWWTGFPKGSVRRLLHEWGDAIRDVAIQGLGGTHQLLTAQQPVLLATTPSETPVVNVLPSLDPYVMGYKERARYLDPQHYSYIFDRSGNATSTLLCDGRIVGVWDMDVIDHRAPVVKIFFLEAVLEEVREELARKARAVGQFITDRTVQVHECDAMIPLTQRTAGAVLSPLKGSTGKKRQS